MINEGMSTGYETMLTGSLIKHEVNSAFQDN